MNYNFKMNKKGDFPSIVFVVISIFIIGIILFFSNHVTDKMYGSLDDYFDSSTEYNNSLAETTIEDINNAENGLWDYGFLAISIGLIIVLMGTAYSTRISPIFYWIYSILSIIILILAVITSNIWQQMASNPEFSETILRFPITNLILGSYYPTFIVAALMLTIVLLFGKGPDRSLA